MSSKCRKRDGNFYRFMFHWGFRLSWRSSLVPTTSLGIRLTRYAPARMLSSCLADIALRLLRMLPASEAVALEGKRGGGAKSSAVKVPDFLSRWLGRHVSWRRTDRDSTITYGLGITERSSNEDAKGRCAGTMGENGRIPPRGLSGRPAARSL